MSSSISTMGGLKVKYQEATILDQLQSETITTDNLGSTTGDSIPIGTGSNLWRFAVESGTNNLLVQMSTNGGTSWDTKQKFETDGSISLVEQ